MKSFNKDFDLNELILTCTNSKDIVARDLREGRQLGINTSPTVFINGKYLEHISLGDISEMIAAELL